LEDPRFSYIHLRANVGLGAALNVAMREATAEIIAYLPTDDLLYPRHLEFLLGALQSEPGSVLAYSGLRHHVNDYSDGQIDGFPLQLVQVAHRAVPGVRWLERQELVTDDLERMYWAQLRNYGTFTGHKEVTCEWVDHPGQHHRRIREPSVE
jgi:hypothetical protein